MTTQVPGGIQENRVRTTLQSLCDDIAGLTPSTPGGSNTHIQYNNSGAFAGSANLTWDGTLNVVPASSPVVTGSLNIGSSGNNTYQLTIHDSNNINVMRVRQVGSGPDIAFGDPEGASHGGVMVLYSGVARFGAANGLTQIGNNSGIGNTCYIEIDDPNTRATFDWKFVLTNNAALYLYDSGTSTYWKWESVNGVWTGTDTTSASLP